MLESLDLKNFPTAVGVNGPYPFLPGDPTYVRQHAPRSERPDLGQVPRLDGEDKLVILAPVEGQREGFLLE